MPTTDNSGDASDKHIQEAKENHERYLRFVEDDRDIDWAIVVLFYSALHLVQAHAERHARRLNEQIPYTHPERDGYVARQLSEIQEDYDLLQSASKDARYKLKKRSKREAETIYSWFEAIRSRLARRKISW
jgi:hypothetical protein